MLEKSAGGAERVDCKFHIVRFSKNSDMDLNLTLSRVFLNYNGTNRGVQAVERNLIPMRALVLHLRLVFTLPFYTVSGAVIL